MSAQTCLVTGSAGFIGSAIAKELLAHGYSVVGLDNLEGGSQSTLESLLQHPSFSFIRGDIRHISDCEQACQGADFVFHQAALASVPESIQKPQLFHENNGTGTLNMLIAAQKAGVKRFIFASSCAVYGDTQDVPISETTTPNPQSPYAVDKLLGEYYCKMATLHYKLPTLSLRYFNVFGPGQNPNGPYAGVIPLFIKAVKEGRAPVIFGTGNHTRDFVSIHSVVAANIAALTATETAFGKAFNIGSGVEISVLQLAKKIQKLWDSNLDLSYHSGRSGDISRSVSDPRLSKQFLGEYDKVSLSEGLVEIVDILRRSEC